MDLAGVDVWIFDLDNTLYPPQMALFPQIEARMTAYVMRLLGLDHDRASLLRAAYWRRHGTTLAGLMAEHDIDPHAYLAEVHDIDFAVLTPAPGLAAAIAALPGRKLVHTNGDSRYARKVLAARGLEVFDAVYGIDDIGFHPKPAPEAFAAVLRMAAIDPGRAAFFEDDARNLEVPHRLGMRTVLVGPGRHGPDGITNLPAIALPAHIHHRTDDLCDFLRMIAPHR